MKTCSWCFSFAPLQTFLKNVPGLAVAAAILGMFSSATAATYYVSPSGSDTNSTTQAQNISTPWKTINHAASKMAAGDTCLIRAGNYPETVTVPVSGTAALPITFSAYSTEIATINGADSLSGWTTNGVNIWDAPMSWTLGDGDQVFINNVMKPAARWPNAGSSFPWQNSSTNPSPDWSYVDTAGYTSGTNGWITDAALPTRADNYWNGATLHMLQGYGWIMKHAAVIAYTNSTKKIYTTDANGANAAYAFTSGNEYYITGIKGEMDSAGEWFYNTSSSKLSIYSTTAPTGVTAKHRNYGFDVRGRAYINLINLDFFSCTIQTDAGATNNTYNGLIMKYLGHSAEDSSVFGVTLQNGDVLRNSDLDYDSRSLIELAGSDIRIINNNLHDSGYNPTWEAMIGNGTGYRNLISHNTLQHSGRGAMGFPGRSSIVEYNDLSDGMKLTTDGAIFYSLNASDNTIVRYNLLHDSPGPVGHLGAKVHGFYIDNQNSGWIVHHNIIWNVPGYAMWINCRQNFDQVFNNSTWGSGQGSLGTSFVTDGESGTHIFNNLFDGLIAGTTWVQNQTDIRYNLYTNPSFVAPSSGDFRLQSTSPAIDQGAVIPGVTDGYTGTAPDLGALEYNGTNWTTSAGAKSTPPSPDPVYSMPAMIFANQVKDGSFETGSLAPNWTTNSGSKVSLLAGTAWSDTRLRSGSYALEFTVGTSEVKQVVTGLQPGRRYKVYGGIQTTNTATTAKLGVRNFGGQSAVEYNIPANTTAITTNGVNQDTLWKMYALAFSTGPTNTTAEIYLDVTIPTGVNPVYADDFSVELSQPIDPQPPYMPILQYAFNESSGTNTADGTTFARNGTVTGGATWTTGVYGNALNFNGLNSYVASPGMNTPTSEITVACWAKSASTTWNADGCLISKRPSFVLHPDIGTTKVRFFVIIGGVQETIYFTPTNGFDITQWHHYAGTYSSSAGLVSIYVDGILQGTAGASGNIDADTGSIFIGADDYPGRFLGGAIDDVRIYDYALTAQEISAIGYQVDINQIVRLKLDETSGTTVAWDASGNGRNGALSNLNTSTAWVPGKVGGALSFNGVDGYAVISSLPVAPTTEITVACWAKSATATWNAYGCLVSKRPSFVLHPDLNHTDVRFFVTIGGVAQTVYFTPPVGFDITQWHHYAGVYSSSAGLVSIYVDGALQSTVAATGTIDPDTGPVFIGADDYPGRFFNGSMDDVQIYTRALSWYEISELAAQAYGSSPPY